MDREVAIIATGARAGENGGKRELFTEETTTALVFENGGVLRLSAAVATGQLLFLTHKETKREVVAHVTRKSAFRPAVCYVEVEFSEPSPGFWGIEFPKTPAVASSRASQKTAHELAQVEADLLAGEENELTSAPSAQEISALKDEVEVLREQLKLMQTQIVSGNSADATVAPEVPLATAPASTQSASQTPVLPQAPGEQLLNLLNAAGEVRQGSATEASGALASAQGAVASASEENDSGKPRFSGQDLLPKPALDFKGTEPLAKRDSKPEQTLDTKGRSAAVRKDVLFAAFVIITAGAAWYQNLLPGLAQRKAAFPQAISATGGHPSSHVPPKTANSPTDASNSLQTNNDASTPPGASAQDTSQPAAAGAEKASTSSASETPANVKAMPDAGVEAPVVMKNPEEDGSARKRSVPPSTDDAAVSDAQPSDGVTIVPPKLIKSVLAVASPGSLPVFAEGAAAIVTFDALVDASGHVKSMKALSGSPSLQKAAMVALKKYRYEPAKRRGKPVPAHVTVTIKFLFEP